MAEGRPQLAAGNPRRKLRLQCIFLTFLSQSKGCFDSPVTIPSSKLRVRAALCRANSAQPVPHPTHLYWVNVGLIPLWIFSGHPGGLPMSRRLTELRGLVYWPC